MPTTREDLDRMLNSQAEDAHYEFKEARKEFHLDRVYKYTSAFANEGGGKLVLGVSDKRPRKIVGTAAFPRPQKLSKQILDKTGLRVNVEVLNEEEGRVLILNMPSRPQGTPVPVDGAYFMRSEDALVPMSPDMLREIFDEGKPDWLSECAKTDLRRQDVIELLETSKFFELMKLPYPSELDSILDRLEREKLVLGSNGRWGITNLGAILIAKKMADFDGLKSKKVRIITYGGTDKQDALRTVASRGGYATSFAGIIKYIETLIPTNELVKQAIRKQVATYPIKAIRELVANALIHQDFNVTGATVTIELYSNRIEISNPGHPSISLDRFIDEYQSRNEKLADLMRRMGICEEKGSGIDDVVRLSEVYQLPPPDFTTSELRTYAIVFSPKKFSAMSKKERIRAAYQHCCLKHVNREAMTNTTLRERFKLESGKAETASRIIQDAQKAGKIKPHDPSAGRKFAKYIPFWA